MAVKKKVLIFACGAVVAGIVLLAYEIFLPHTAFRGKKEVIVAPGMGSRVIGGLLKKEGFIGSRWAFVFYVSARGEAPRLKPGEYVFFETAAIPDIARDLVVGSARERAITIPEGWSTSDIARYFAEQNIAPASAAQSFFAHPPEQMIRAVSFLAARPPAGSLEGYLFPDTYRVFDDATLESIALKMLDNFDRKLTPDLRQEIARQRKTIADVVIMASLLEKEVVLDNDRAIAAGILWKRLDAGIPLQVDATVVYAKTQLGSGASKLGGGARKNGKISLADTNIDSPYNTYKYRGLPQGPISNPGLSAIRAAVYPKSSPYLYYLSAPDGRTIFSRTLEEHNTAKAKYLR